MRAGGDWAWRRMGPGGEGPAAPSPRRPERRRRDEGRRDVAGAEEAERVDVAEAPALAADAEVDPARGATERLAGADRLARPHRDARERRIGHAPATAPHADRALARHAPREHDPAGAGRPHRAREPGSRRRGAGRARRDRRPGGRGGSAAPIRAATTRGAGRAIEVHAASTVGPGRCGGPARVGVNRCGLVRLSSRLGTDRWRLRP